MKVTAIDPGTEQSAIITWDGEKIYGFDLLPNPQILAMLRTSKCDHELVIEQIKSYGNTMGQTTIDTAVWIGRFYEAWAGRFLGSFAELMPRVEVKKHICLNGLAKDTNIIQALVDRFAYGLPNRGKGTKKDPGFFYGFKKDIWQGS